ncbi:MAG: FUSC family protein [Marmoricola sp.]
MAASSRGAVVRSFSQAGSQVASGTPPWLRHQIDAHRTDLVKALRAALAAATAWIVAQQLGALLGGPVEHYAYYAPLGAVVAVTGTVAGSVRESARALGAVLIGASFAVAVEPLADSSGDALALGLAVLVGMVVSTWHRLGSMGSWVPVAAMFVLLTGSSHLEDYLIGYLGLMTLGAVVGVVANAIFAPLPLRRSGREVRELRDTLSGQLCDAASALRRDDPPTREEWEEQQRAIIPLSRRTSEVVRETSEARRANWRARRWRDSVQQQYELARSLEQLAYLVDDLTTLLRRNENAETEERALGPRLRPAAADLLDAMSGVLRDLDQPVAGGDALRHVDAAMGTLVEQIRRTRGDTGDDLFIAGAIVLAARRAVTALAPPDLADELPSRH